jgi:hypothetical protein
MDCVPARWGNRMVIREEVYRMNSIAAAETTWQDLRYSLRVLFKSPTFAIGPGHRGQHRNVHLDRGMLLRPLEYRSPERLVRLSLGDMRGSERDGTFSVWRLEHLRASAKSFSSVGAYLKFKEDMSLAGNGTPEALKAARVFPISRPESG